MGVAHYVVLEKEIPGLDTEMSGKALASAQDNIYKLCGKLKLTPLMDYYSFDSAELAEYLGDEPNEADSEDAEPEEWFDAQLGLNTVDSLVMEIQAAPGNLKESEYVLEDLLNIQRILTAAKTESVGWHLDIDF